MGDFKIGTFVWAKMKGFPSWPGLIAEPPKDLKAPSKANSHCIYFFGTKNYCWLEQKFLQHYEDAKEENSKAKTAGFNEACKEIEEHISSGSTTVPSTTTTPTVQESPQKKRRNSKLKEPKEADEKESSKSDSENFSTPKEVPKKKVKKSLNGSIAEGSERRDAERETPSKKPRLSVIERPPHEDPIIEQTDLSKVPKGLKDKKVSPSEKTIGFIGLGIMGSRLAKNILLSGHKLMVWNRTSEKSEQFASAGAEIGLTPADVVQRSDIVFSCVSGPVAARKLVFGNCGVLSEICDGKGYVELTTIDKDTSIELSESIKVKGGRYLEAQMVGSRDEAESGNIIFLCAGDASLYDDCASCLRANSSHPPQFLGPPGAAVTSNLILQAIQGIALAGFTEHLSVAPSYNIKPEIFERFMDKTDANCKLFKEKFKMMIGEGGPTSLPLQHHQKDMRMILDTAQSFSHPMNLTSTINENLKYAVRLGLGSHDVSYAYKRALDY